MKIKKIIVAFMFLGGFTAYSQTDSLNATWVLDSAKIVKSSDKSIAEIRKLAHKSAFGAYDLLKFQDNILTVSENGDIQQGQAEITDNKIAFSFAVVPIEMEYKIKDNVLFLERRISFPGGDTYIVLTQYKKVL